MPLNLSGAFTLACTTALSTSKVRSGNTSTSSWEKNASVLRMASPCPCRRSQIFASFPPWGLIARKAETKSGDVYKSADASGFAPADPIVPCTKLGVPLQRQDRINLRGGQSVLETPQANSKRQDTLACHSLAVQRVISAIRGRLDENISLTEMASVAYMSRYHFNRTFRQITGLP